MAVTAWKFPTNRLTPSGWHDWNNIMSDDSTYAYSNAGGTSDMLGGYDYDFSLPSNAIVDGVEVAIHKDLSGGTDMYDLAVKLRLPSVGFTGSDMAGYSNWSGAGEVIHGGPTTLWVSGLDKSDVESSSFGAGISCYGYGSEVGQIEYIKIRIYYTVPVAPTVTTQAADTIGTSTATGNGNITDDGGASITQHGVCWKKGSAPASIYTADGYSTEGSGSEGAFTSDMDDLYDGSGYYYKAYAGNSAGTGYGAAVEFDTMTQILEIWWRA